MKRKINEENLDAKEETQYGYFVTVIMSVLNGEKYLRESIDSICNQTLDKFEFIIIDDGSNDNTQRILQEYSKKYSYIKIITNEENLGQSISKNKAIKIAKGKYIASMDGDDIAHPKRLQKQADYLESHHDIYLVGSNTNIIDHEGSLKIKLRENGGNVTINNILKNKKNPCHSTIMFRNIGSSTVLYRNKIIYVQDKDLYLRILESGFKIYILREKLLNYRSHPDQITSSKIKENSFFLMKVHQFYHERKKGKDSIDLLDKIKCDPLYNSKVHKFIVQDRTLFSSFRKNNISRMDILKHLYKSTHLKLGIYYPRFKFYLPIILIFTPRRLIINLIKIKKSVLSGNLHD